MSSGQGDAKLFARVSRLFLPVYVFLSPFCTACPPPITTSSSHANHVNQEHHGAQRDVYGGWPGA